MSHSADRAWLISGASSGLGRALAEQVVERGERLIATARDPATLVELAARGGARVVTAALDVTRAADITAAIDTAQRAFGRIDVLINNAGYGFIGAVEEASDAEVRAQFEVNFFGLAALTRAVLPLMRAQRGGTIVNISSIAGARGRAAIGYYCASKWAVEGFSESLAAECAPLGIRVLIVEPGPFRTDFSGRSIVLAERTIGDYQAAQEVRSAVRRMDGTQPGDPVRGARLILETCLAPDPPQRLVLGGVTYEAVRRVAGARLQDVERSAAVAVTADFPANDLAWAAG
jgi:NAD(P)-dependent dehydrogenase (short-subunit alcohol dehydrogenase family)